MEKIYIYNNQEIRQDTSRGRKRALSPAESYLLTLVRYRQNYSIYHLAYLFETSEGNTSNTITSWTNFMYLKLGSIPIWPTQEQIRKIMPKSMKDKFPNVRCIIDCVEFKVAVPSSLFLHKMMYSDYKSHTTVKALVGIAPRGGFTFVSSLYPGSISDKDITLTSGILNAQF